jgi:myo-inositol 2-dehydrogenase/D-chiro-inositol 1-dehydrogenase
MCNSSQTRPFQSLDEAIYHGPLDAVVVSSPTFTHEAVITQAASDGLHVFTEKPVDETADKIARLFEIAARGGISLCCGFQRRFDASYVAAANAVRTGKIGTPVTANMFFADHPCPPKEFLLKGGNIFMDLSAHDVDYIMQVLKDDVVSVYASGTSSTDELAAAGVHDNANVLMKFSRGTCIYDYVLKRFTTCAFLFLLLTLDLSSGTVVNLFMSRSATYGYDQRCEIFGDGGLISTHNKHAHSVVLSNGGGVLHSKLKHSFPQRFNQAFASELDAFCSTLLLGTPWPVTADQCVRVQKVADAAKLSCDEDRVVQISCNNEIVPERVADVL